MDYPRSVFVMDKKKTEENMRKYRKYQDSMYRSLENGVCNYHQLTLRERCAAIKAYKEANPFSVIE